MFNLVWALLLSSLSSFPALHHACNQFDHDFLESFSLHVSASPPVNWSSSIDCCFWEGISCDGEGWITSLWLPARGIRGVFWPSIWNVTHLSHLNLSHNQLSGSLATGFISPLIDLETLDLSYNSLSGKLPSILPLRHIKTVDLSSNHFRGKIPSTLFYLSGNLTSFNVSNNSFTGPIPPSICSNSSFSVKLLDFSYNGFSGQISHGLGECSQLQVFRAGFNYLSGWIPTDIYNTTKLHEFSLPSNRLSGHISNAIIHFANLVILELYSNELTGLIPREIGKLSNLEHLLLYTNKLSGSLPTSLSNCTKLVTLNLRMNSLEGDLSAFNFSNLVHLRKLDVFNNSFTGSFPKSLYSSRSLTAVRLAKNMIEGQILPDILLMQSLSFLSLSANKLTNITGAIKILMGCKNLTTLILAFNFLNEAVPDDDSIGQSNGFQNLKFLSLAGCQLNGQLPAWLAKLKKLEVLNLSINRITGSIPVWLGTLPSLFYIDLSNNFLSGNLPNELCRLPALMPHQVNEHVKWRYLELPVLGNPGLVYNELTYWPPSMHLGCNGLGGKIPVEIGQLKLLHGLNLSHNNFSGNIPDELSNLTNLERLDLSRNHLTGEIPISLKGNNFLSWFSVADNNLQGLIPAGGQFDTFPSSSFSGNPRLRGSIVQSACTVQPVGTTHPIIPKESSSSSNTLVLGVISGLISGFVGGFVWGLTLYPIQRLKFLRRFRLP